MFPAQASTESSQAASPATDDHNDRLHNNLATAAAATTAAAAATSSDIRHHSDASLGVEQHQASHGSQGAAAQQRARRQVALESI